MANKKKAREVIVHVQSQFTPEELQVLYRAMQTTWGEIASDALQMADDGVMARDEVIELVLDADRMRFHMPKDQLPLYNRFMALDIDVMSKIAEGTFKHTRYCM